MSPVYCLTCVSILTWPESEDDDYPVVYIDKRNPELLILATEAFAADSGYQWAIA